MQWYDAFYAVNYEDGRLHCRLQAQASLLDNLLLMKQGGSVMCDRT